MSVCRCVAAGHSQRPQRETETRKCPRCWEMNHPNCYNPGAGGGSKQASTHRCQFTRSSVSVRTTWRWWAMRAARKLKWGSVSSGSSPVARAPLADASKPAWMPPALPRNVTEARRARRILATSFAPSRASSSLSHRNAYLVSCPSMVCSRLCHLHKGANSSRRSGVVVRGCGGA